MGLHKGQTNKTSFIKGGKPWNIGKKLTEEHRQALSESHKGHKQSKEQIQKRVDKRRILIKEGKIEYYKSNKIREHMRKLGLSKKGIPSHRKGVKLSKEIREKISMGNKGKIPWNYIDGRSKMFGPGRYGDNWNKIRMEVYTRDGFCCQKCGISMSETKSPHHVHHIVPFLDTFDNSLSNLITLCPSCHRIEEARLIKLRRKEL